MIGSANCASSAMLAALLCRKSEQSAHHYGAYFALPEQRMLGMSIHSNTRERFISMSHSQSRQRFSRYLLIPILTLSFSLSACGEVDADRGPEQGLSESALAQACEADSVFASANGHAQGASMKAVLMASFEAAKNNDLDAFMAIAASPYIQHSPDLPDGWKPVWDLLKDRPAGFSSTQMRWLGDKGFLDNGNYLVMFRQVDRGDGTGPSKIVDIMRFDDEGKYAEHWDIRQPLAAESSHESSETQSAQRFLDAPVEYDLETEEANKQTAIRFLNTAFNDGARDVALKQFAASDIIQHAAPSSDEVQSMRCYDIQRVVAQNDLVVVHSKVTGSAGVDAVVDIMRIRDGKLVEHWDVIQPAPAAEDMPHKNGMF